MCEDVFADMNVDISTDMRVGMCVGMCAGMRVDMLRDVHVAMLIHTPTDMCKTYVSVCVMTCI